MSASIINFSLMGMVEMLPVAFIVIILVFAFSIILRSLKLVGLQLILVLVMFIFNTTFHPALTFIAIGIQFALGIFLVYKYFQALERNYQLILEKTHQAPPYYTKTNGGEQKAFM